MSSQDIVISQNVTSLVLPINRSLPTYTMLNQPLFQVESHPYLYNTTYTKLCAISDTVSIGTYMQCLSKVNCLKLT